jgi:hypothetical protein
LKEETEIAENILKSIGIDDHMIIKLKSPKKDCWVGMYKALSQFRGNCYPIFWISPRITKTERIETILHEYGHVIEEYIRKRAPDFKPERETLYGEENLLEFWQNREELAENFISYALGHSFRLDWKEKEAFDELVSVYREISGLGCKPISQIQMRLDKYEL